jgi:hypothetical protein
VRRVLTGAAALIFATLPVSGRAAAGDSRTYLIAVGNNQPQPGAGSDKSLLRFADDDAAAFYDLFAAIADDAHLLTSMDRDTQALYPRLAVAARPPTVVELQRTVASIATSIAYDHVAGRRSVVFLFYSGHGSTGDERGPPELALLDGGISQSFLYDEVLARLPADYLHLFIDACHAEAVVRPRDAEAREVTIGSQEANAVLLRATLARFPNVGTIVAASTSAQSHEWDLLAHGVFTHELLSALRGGSDVNHDGLIEYSEVYAFLTAANRGVADPRARLDVVARAPLVDRRVALVNLTHFPSATTTRLTGISLPAGLVQIEDGAGRSIASLRPEPGFVADVVVPAGGTIYVHADTREARFAACAGETVAFDGLAFAAPGVRARGALAEAMSRGLFATAFGRGYYMGFVDQAPDLIPVAFETDLRATALPRSVPAVVRVWEPAARPLRTGEAVVVGIGAARPVARDFGLSESVRLGLRPRAGRGFSASFDLVRAAGAQMAEWQALASAGWIVARERGPLRGWVGVAGGGGIIAQVITGAAPGISGAIVAGPMSGLSLDLPHRWGLWLEAQFFGMTLRRDDRSVIVAAPAAWLGVSLGL